MGAALAVFGAGCGDDEEGGGGTPKADVKKFPAGTTLGKIQQEGVITIGVKYDVPPFGFKNPQSNKGEGFDVDLGQAVADALGVQIHERVDRPSAPGHPPVVRPGRVQSRDRQWLYTHRFFVRDGGDARYVPQDLLTLSIEVTLVTFDPLDQYLR